MKPRIPALAPLALGLLVVAGALAAPPAAPSRIDDLIARMTLAEKIALLTGAADPKSVGQAGTLAGVPRLGIPSLRLADGPAGVRVARPATALPAPVALAATFDTALARRYGAAMGTEARALGIDILLAPMVNLVRVPEAGRNFETFGEDPVLAARMAAAQIRGIQGAGTMATVKHFAVNNFENGRQTVSAEVDDRTFREMYLPAFEAAVDAGAASIMASYNRINGTFATENSLLLTSILRDEWKFGGFVMSDWFATRSTAPSLRAGMDLEMPGAGMGPRPGFYGAKLTEALSRNEITMADLDRSLRRILTTMDRFGHLGGARTRPARDVAGAARTAKDIAIAGMVLLRNRGDLLPLARATSLAVIGPTARTALVGGGGSAHVVPDQAKAPLATLRQRAQATFAPGLDLAGEPIPASALGAGLSRTAAGAGPAPVPGPPAPPPTATGPVSRIDANLDLVGDAAVSPGAVLWTGTLSAPETGDYSLLIQTDARASLWVDDTAVGTAGGFFGGNASLIATSDGLVNAGTTVRLARGVPRRITVLAGPGGGFGPGSRARMQVRLAWVTPARRRQRMAEAVVAARAASVAVVFAHDEGTEGNDRIGLSLPLEQDALIAEVAAANPRTVVVLQTGSCVTMPWVDRVGAIVEAWYPGQEGADAVAEVLFGEAVPGGRLTVTFPAHANDTATAKLARYPGIDGKATYDEGNLFGYRHHDATGKAPLFAFGHGLSWSRVDYADLAVKSGPRGSIDVSFTVRNPGARTTIEVPQVYLGTARGTTIPMAPKQLAAFASVRLRPGETRSIRLMIDARARSIWSTVRKAWIVVPGRRDVLVG
ncbi:MAG: beta-glucosidase, partial [Armatimonadota bacterium]